jgi:hypothetical protein
MTARLKEAKHLITGIGGLPAELAAESLAATSSYLDELAVPVTSYAHRTLSPSMQATSLARQRTVLVPLFWFTLEQLTGAACA